MPTIPRPQGLDIPDRRALTALFVDPPEIREAGDDGWTFVGYAAVFDRLSVDLGGFRERILRGAFRDVLADPDLDVTLVADHGLGALTTVASTRGGTLRLSEDARGLRVEATIAPTSVGNDLRILIGRGDVQGMSFGFRVSEGGDDWTRENGELIRTVRQVAFLYDVSIVSFPAYPDTDVEARSRGLLVEQRQALHLFDRQTGRLVLPEVRRIRERVTAHLLDLTDAQRAALEHAEQLLAGSVEQRETYGDLYTGLQAALDEKFADAYYYVWIVDFTDEMVVFSMGGLLFSAPFTVTDGPLEIGEHIQVRPRTEYVPTAAAGDEAEERDRLGDRLRLMRMQLEL